DHPRPDARHPAGRRAAPAPVELRQRSQGAAGALHPVLTPKEVPVTVTPDIELVDPGAYEHGGVPHEQLAWLREHDPVHWHHGDPARGYPPFWAVTRHEDVVHVRSEEHTSELQSRENLVCRLLLENKQRPQARSDEDP